MLTVGSLLLNRGSFAVQTMPLVLAAAYAKSDVDLAGYEPDALSRYHSGEARWHFSSKSFLRVGAHEFTRANATIVEMDSAKRIKIREAVLPIGSPPFPDPAMR